MKKRSRTYASPTHAVQRARAVLAARRTPSRRALCALSDRLTRAALAAGSGTAQRDVLHYQRQIERKAGGCD